ncbi:MAG: ribonuclease P protein component [Sphingobacteriales bacterium]|nr:MAG: ribonuclease P protein component [Sphingobacteriales bacterium]
MSIKKTFSKEERLCSKVLLGALFTQGSSFLVYPYRLTWLVAAIPQTMPAQVVIGVSKKKFRKSVDRNLIKRKIKEAYRLNKAQLLYTDLDINQKKIIFSINYIGKDILDFDTINIKLKNALIMLCKQIFVATV